MNSSLKTLNPNPPNEIKISKYWNAGNGHIILREALEITHPEHPYNLVIAMGLIPEEYGFIHPTAEKYQDHSRNQLLGVITRLEQEVENLLRYC
jgi:hypothetical protein